MEAQQAASMADGDQCRAWQGFAQQPIHRVLQSFVHSGTGFVQEHCSRTVQQHAADRQSLLLAKGQDPRPIIFFIEAGDQMPEMASTQYRSGLIIGLRRDTGIVQRRAQRTQRQVGLLRQE